MSDDFIDSNVFVYLFDETDAHKNAIARRVIEDALADGTGAISYQVVQETLHVIMRKLPVPVTSPDAKQFLHRVLEPLWQIMPSATLIAGGIDIQDRYRYGFYDSLIIAAALEAGCKRLLSEDMQHGQRIDRLTIENPFL
ncbi:PIN domain-containing protein [Salinisphaera sp.]|uniref:PIN domain-containing protein n=1 Tax=Salinisphaera sp. TaxID=1914330 RepID=UPI002D76E83C|nr:PIN domain-containing protein [Salinisphaera sp.]HET7313231.1 PIN domain-containing protein [Salinisphaera sp.]